MRKRTNFDKDGRGEDRREEGRGERRSGEAPGGRFGRPQRQREEGPGPGSERARKPTAYGRKPLYDKPFRENRDRDAGDRGLRQSGDDRPGRERPFARRESRNVSDEPGHKPRFRREPERSDKRGYGERDAPRNPRADFRKNTPAERKDRSEKPANDGLIRLNRFIANAGICSRREADELIESGQITVNGKVVSEMGFKVKSSDIVKYGKRVLNAEKLVYILLNKPKDYITTTEDPEDRRTVLQLIGDACEERVYPVGRLDRNTTGLLLITNDGELADKLTHPSHNIKKIYQAELDKPITVEDFEALKKGVELEDGFIKPDDIGIVTPDAYVVGVEIHSGRNRIVRRIFEHFGYEVKKLDRTTFAGLNKKDLPRGKWRFLTQKEVVTLKFLV